MQFEFASATTPEGRTLPVLREIPDGPIVWIEGRNGIGKSLSVRLLELATGGAPYATDPQAWLSLKHGTGPISVRAHDQSVDLAFELDPTRWDEDPLKQQWVALGPAFLNRKPASRADVMKRLQVVRIAGEEGLTRAVGSQFLQLASKVGLYAEEMADPSASADRQLADLMELLAAANPFRTDQTASDLAAAQEVLHSATETLGPVAERVRMIERAIEAAESLEALDAQGPALRNRMASLKASLSDAHARRERAVTDLTAAAASRPGSARSKELARIERLVTQRERAADKAAATVTQAAGRADVAANVQAIVTERAAITEALSSEGARRADLARADAVRTFLSGLLSLLDDSVGLDGRSVLVEVGGQSLTRDLLQDAASSRRAELDSTDVAREIDQVDERIRSLVERREAVALLAEALRVLNRKRQLVRDGLASLEQLEAGLKGARGAFKEARKRLDQAVEDAERLTLEKQEAERALAALARGWTEQELLDQIRAVNEPVDRLPQIRDGLREQDAELRRERDLAQRSVDEARLVNAEAVADSDQSRQALAGSADWAWFRRSIGTPDTWTTSWVTRVQRSVGAVKDKVAAVYRSTRAVETGLCDLAAHVSEARPLTPPTPLGDAVIAACEDRVRDEFMTPTIRAALVDGATIDAVDLRNPSLTWEDAGLRVIRPFSAFSSGEQAFAYARARIEQVHRRENEHLLLVLDEFSAFIAGDRRRLLNRLLAERIEEGAVSQVLLIVPLSQDYVQTAADAGDAASPTLKRRARAVKAYGYFAEVVGE